MRRTGWLEALAAARFSHDPDTPRPHQIIGSCRLRRFTSLSVYLFWDRDAPSGRGWSAYWDKAPVGLKRLTMPGFESRTDIATLPCLCKSSQPRQASADRTCRVSFARVKVLLSASFSESYASRSQHIASKHNPSSPLNKLRWNAAFPTRLRWIARSADVWGSPLRNCG